MNQIKLNNLNILKNLNILNYLNLTIESEMKAVSWEGPK